MKKYLSAVAFVLVVTATFAIAQVGDAVIADVPFSFVVGKTTLPAGTYEFTASGDLDSIRITQKGGKGSAVASVITRLSPRDEKEGSVVFDLAGDAHHLSEIYMPGIDGFQVQGATVKHTHVRIKTHK